MLNKYQQIFLTYSFLTFEKQNKDEKVILKKIKKQRMIDFLIKHESDNFQNNIKLTLKQTNNINRKGTSSKGIIFYDIFFGKVTFNT